MPNRRAVAKRDPCIECGKSTIARDFVTDESVCLKCRRSLSKYRCITATRAKKEFGLTDADLEILPVLEKRNPHYSCAAPMRLYRLSQVKALAAPKCEKCGLPISDHD